MIIKNAIASILTLLPFSQMQAAETWIEGAIYTTPSESGYTVLKMLKVDSGGVHIRMYSNLYSAKPRSVDEASLFMAGIDREEGVPLGMGHVPVSHDSFASWGVEFIQYSKVTENELEGYLIWLESEGGYF